MQRDSHAVPTRATPRLASRLNSLVKRWSSSLASPGIDQYSFVFAGQRRVPLAWRFESGRASRLAYIEVTEHPIWLDRLPEAFRGFRIVQLTDIHHGLFLPLQAVIDAVKLVNHLEPDLVALTGDFVTYSQAYIAPVAAVLGCLRARYGVFAVLGNHDFRVGAEQLTRALRREKIEVLRNRHSPIRRAGQTLYIAGVDDLRYRADLQRALRGIPAGAPSILLSHNPAIIRRAARCGVNLVLSGHTHGGQVNLPLLGNIYGRSPEQLRFKVGWDRLGPTQIYVSRGIGTVVLPVRLRCPAEVPQFHLQPHNAGSGFIPKAAT